MTKKKDQYALDHKPVSLTLINHARINQFRKGGESMDAAFTRICDLANVPMPDTERT